MDVYDVLDQIVALLQRRGRVTYNALKLQFTLDDDQLAVLTNELLYAHPQVVEDAGRGLRWTGDPAATQAPAPIRVRISRWALGEDWMPAYAGMTIGASFPRKRASSTPWWNTHDALRA